MRLWWWPWPLNLVARQSGYTLFYFCLVIRFNLLSWKLCNILHHNQHCPSHYCSHRFPGWNSYCVILKYMLYSLVKTSPRLKIIQSSQTIVTVTSDLLNPSSICTHSWWTILSLVLQSWDWALGFGLQRLYNTGYFVVALSVLVASAFVFGLKWSPISTNWSGTHVSKDKVKVRTNRAENCEKSFKM